MKRKPWLILSAALIAAVPLTASATEAPEEFERAVLRVEINSTDGDAGLQIDLDHDPWKWVLLRNPYGWKILDVQNRGTLRTYGLTELFSESSEPPFGTFPLSEFKELFPAGVYIFEGATVDGIRLRSTFRLTHDFPAGPVITSPREDSTVEADDLVVRWQPVTRPAGIDIARYQVLVIYERDPIRTFSVFVPARVHSVRVPAAFLASDGLYAVEVLAIERSGNQTLTEHEFRVR